MELRHLRAFIAVAEELSFRRAATRLHMAQPPLSQQIKLLEREVGTSLFHRTTRQVALTAAGEAFLPEARRALAAAAAAPRLAREAAAGHIGKVRLGFTGPASYRELLVVARAIRRHRPGVQLDTVGPWYSGELVDRLHRRDADAGLIRLPARTAGLHCHEIAQHPFAAVVPTGHPFAQRDDIAVLDLHDQPLIGVPSNRGSAAVTAIHSGFMKHGISPRIVQEAPDMHTVMLLVGAGAGLALVLQSADHLKVPGIALVPISDMPPLPLALAWRNDGVNPAVAILVQLLDDIKTNCNAT